MNLQRNQVHVFPATAEKFSVPGPAYVWHSGNLNWVPASTSGGVFASSCSDWRMSGFTHYFIGGKPAGAPLPAPIATEGDAALAWNIQEAASHHPTQLGPSYIAACMGLTKGRELERKFYEEREKRSEEAHVFTISELRRLNNEAHNKGLMARIQADEQFLELAALRLECNGLRTRLEGVRQALSKPI